MVGPLPRRNRRSPRRKVAKEIRLRRPIVISPRAHRDLREIQDYLDERSPQAGLAFEDEAEQALIAIAARPMSGRIVKPSPAKGAPLRVQSLSRRFWRYLIYYRVFSSSVRIVRVLHGARNLRAILRLKD